MHLNLNASAPFTIDSFFSDRNSPLKSFTKLMALSRILQLLPLIVLLSLILAVELKIFLQSLLFSFTLLLSMTKLPVFCFLCKEEGKGFTVSVFWFFLATFCFLSSWHFLGITVVSLICCALVTMGVLLFESWGSGLICDCKSLHGCWTLAAVGCALLLARCVWLWVSS